MIHSIKKIVHRFFRSGITTRREIDPDEIFLDSKNLPEFDTHQFEGRIEKPVSKRSFLFMGIFFAVVGIIFVGKVWNLQIVQGEAFETRSQNNHLRHTTIFANRGLIVDRNGEHLAWNIASQDDDFSLRKYTTLSGISHVVGYLKYPSKDAFGFYYDETFSGKDGVELLYSSEISGQNGLKITETDALGDIQSENTLRPPKDGENLSLSIDAKVSDKFYDIISKTASDFGFTGGAGAIMDVHTGEILTLVSFPEYDLDVMTQGDDRTRIGELLNDKDNPFLNRAVSGLYIPGSIVKPFVALSALEEGIISPNKQIMSTGSISIPNPYNPSQSTIFRDWKAHGLVDMRRALAVSSNVYFFAIGGGFADQPGLGISKVKSYLERFGFGSETRIDLSSERKGNIPSPQWKEENFDGDPWRLGDTYNTSIGQYGFQVSPIQVVRAMSALTNGGNLLTPTVKKIPEGKKPESIRLNFNQDNLKIVMEGVRMSVTDGTASGLSMPSVRVAAKTGTAELGALKQFVNSWVTGFFPYENPKYSFVVIMERGPRANTIGGVYVMRQLLEWMSVNTPQYLE